MQQIKVTLETVTPLFLGGAKGKEGPPELRPPAFRGAMRYWFRAIAGGVIGDGDSQMTVIRAKETDVFGNAEEMHGQSSVWSRLSYPKYDENFKALLLPHRDNTFSQLAIPIGAKPCLTLTLKPAQNVEKLEVAIWSLLAAVTLGGIGKRSRRGFGSFQVSSIEQSQDLNLSAELREVLSSFSEPPANSMALARHISELLAGARKQFGSFLHAPLSASALPKYSILTPDNKIMIWQPIGNEAFTRSRMLSTLMSELSDTKSEDARSFDDAFGRIKPSRRASPLWVCVHQFQNNKYGLVLTHLKAEYTENWRGDKHQLVESFIQNPPKGWFATEVRYD